MSDASDSLTLFVLPCDVGIRHHPRDAIRSFGTLATKMLVMTNRDLSSRAPKVETDWYAYLYSDEVIDEQVRRALPVFLRQKYDYIVLMKMDENQSPPLFYQAPRIFRRGILLQPGTLLPENPGELRCERLLDGWVKSC